MKKILINILLFGSVLFGSESIVGQDLNSTDTTINSNINKETNNTIIQDVNTSKASTTLTVVHKKPIISKVNINAKEDDEVLVAGFATSLNFIDVVLVHNNNERIIAKTLANRLGKWQIVKGDISKTLDDGTYDIFVSSFDRKTKVKSEIASKKGFVRDTTIKGTLEISDGSSFNDGIINLKELKTFSIKGKIDTDSKIVSLVITNDVNSSKKIVLGSEDLQKVNDDGSFDFTLNEIDLSKLDDGKINVIMNIEDKHNNKLTLKSSILKDTTPPDKPVITDYVKEKNMIYGKVPNLLVFGGTAEVDSTIEAIIFNTKYPKLKTMGKTKTPPSGKWVLSGRDFAIGDLKDGQIQSQIVQIDKAGNRSESVIIVLNKQRPSIFPKKIKVIPPQNYMPIFTINTVTDKVKSIAVSKNYIIAGSFEFLYYFDKVKGKLQKKIEIKDRWVDSMILNGNQLIIGLDNGDVQIRDLNSSDIIHTIKADKMPILSIIVDKKENRLVTASSDGNVAIWDLATYKQLYLLKKHQWDVTALAIHGDILYTGSEDYSLKMWDIKTGKLLKSLKSAHDGAINSIVIYKNMLITASDDKMIFVRDLKSGRLLHILKGHRKAVNELKINHDTLVSASADRTLILWNLHTFQQIKQLRGHSRSILSMDINDENIVTGGMDYKIRIWGYDESLQGQGEIDETVLGKYDLIRSLDISNDTVTALAHTENEIVFSTKGYIFFYNNITYKFSRSYSTLDKVFASKKNKDEEANSDDEWGDDEEATTDDGNSDDGWADESDDDSGDDDEQPLWESKIEAVKKQRELEASNNLQWVNDIDIEGTVLVAALGYKNLKVWDLDRNQAVKLIEGHESSVLSIAKTDGYYVTSSSDGVVKVWNDETFALTVSIDAHQWDVRTVVVDDGKIYTGSDDYSIKIWDMETGDLIKAIKSAHTGSITKLLITNKYLISSSLDGTIKFRDKQTGELIRTLKVDSPVNTIVNDEEHLISGSDDHTIRVWDLSTGKLIKSMDNGHTAGVSALMIIDDYIVSGGKDKKISIWKYYE